MIEVAGMQEDEAKQKLVKMGLDPTVEYVQDDSVAEGTVIGSDVKRGPSWKPGLR